MMYLKLKLCKKFQAKKLLFAYPFLFEFACAVYSEGWGRTTSAKNCFLSICHLLNLVYSILIYNLKQN